MTTEKINQTIAKMLRDDTEFITPETVAMFSGCTEEEAAIVLLERAHAKIAGLQRQVDLLSMDLNAARGR